MDDETTRADQPKDEVGKEQRCTFEEKLKDLLEFVSDSGEIVYEEQRRVLVEKLKGLCKQKYLEEESLWDQEIGECFEREDRWWAELPEAEKTRLLALSEAYRDLDDFLRMYLGHNNKVEYGEWIASNIRQELKGMFADWDALCADLDKARCRRDRVVAILKGYLDESFDLRGKKADPNLAEQFRKWSHSLYKGATPKELIQGTPYSAEYVRTNVHRHRKERESLSRYICRTIWEREQQ